MVGASLLLAGGAITAIVTAPKPDFDKMLRQASALVEREEYQAALDGLNKKLQPYVNHGDVKDPLRGQFHLLRARAVYLGQKKAGVDREENARTVVDEYSLAKQHGAPPEPRDSAFLADCYVSLGKYGRAIDLAAELPADQRAARGRILKRIVDRQLADPAQSSENSLKLLADYLKDGDLSPADRAWALARQAELLVRQGLLESAIAKLVQTMPSLVDTAGPEALGELYLILGRCYLETGAIAEAARQLETASHLLLQTDPRWAHAEVLLGRIDELIRTPEDGREQARQKYQTVLDRFIGSPARLPALLAMGELEAQAGDKAGVEASLAAYSELVQAMMEGASSHEVSVQSVTTSLLDRAAARFSNSDFEASIRYATLAERLHARDAAPPEVLLAIATAHRASAEQTLAPVRDAERAAPDLASLDPATREQVRLHLLTAGAYFKRHADRIGIADNAGFGRSLWQGADSFDLGGEAEQAIALFSDYARYFPGDSREPEARYRLGMAYQARGDYTTASEAFRSLVADAQSAGSPAGPFADASLVPLAQCILLDADASNDHEAEDLLNRVLRGEAGGTTTLQYRSALVTAASIKTRRGDFAGAIQHLEEAVQRYPDDPQRASLLYNLADACRLDARAISRTLTDAMPDSRKQQLLDTRLQRLRRAQELFEEVRVAIESRDPRRLTGLDRLQLRNSYFFVADCAFEIKDFDTAIRRYDAARERYAQDPASMVAMMQIVNAYVEMGDLTRAATAQQRAVMFYRSIPAAAWADPDLPISREDWQHWLDSMRALRPLGEAAAPPVQTPIPLPGNTAAAGTQEP
jgi:tetratricopeptide (TPR) repeat protein